MQLRLQTVSTDEERAKACSDHLLLEKYIDEKATISRSESSGAE